MLWLDTLVNVNIANRDEGDDERVARGFDVLGEAVARDRVVVVAGADRSASSGARQVGNPGRWRVSVSSEVRMRFPWVVGIVAGCAPEREVTDWGEVDGEGFLILGERPADAFSDRVMPERSPAARLVPDGPLLVHGAAYPGELVVVDPTPWPRVVLDSGDVRVLLYVERGALQPRVPSGTTGTGFGGEGAVTFTESTPVELVDEDGERVLATSEGERLTVQAWWPRSSVDEVYDVGPLEPEAAGPGERVALFGGVEILDAPGGEAIGWVGGDPHAAQTHATVHGDGERGYLPVLVVETGVRVRGWVHEDDVSPNTAFGWGSRTWCTCCGGGRMRTRSFPADLLPMGSWLYAEPGGPVVGIALETLWLPVDRPEPWAPVVRDTALGEVRLWAAPEDLVPAER